MKSLIVKFLAAPLLVLVLVPFSIAQQGDAYYEDAVRAYEDKEYDASFIHLKNALQANPNHIPARLLLAQLYFNSGDIYAAEKEASEALLLGADINLILPIYGTSLVLQKRVDELMELEKVYDSFTPQSRFEWALLKGQAYIVKREPELAMAEFEKAAAMFPADVRANNTLATVYIGLDMHDKAEALLEKSLILDPDNEKTWQLSGDLALRQKNYVLAKERLLRAHEVDPEDPKVLRGLARVSLELNDRVGLRRYLDLILKQSPDDPTATLLSAVMLMEQDSGELGQEMLADLSTKLSNLDDAEFESDDGIIFIRATADYVQRNDESARTLLSTYLGKRPDDLVAMRMLVDVYLRNGQPAQAASLLSSSKAVVVQDFGLTLQLIHLYIGQRNILAAQELLDEANRRAGNHPLVVMMEAEFLKARQQPEAALALLNGQSLKGVEPLPYGLLRGQLELALGQFHNARKSVERMQLEYPEDVRIYNFAAITYMRSGQWDVAEGYIDKALALNGSDINARFNRAMLLKRQRRLDESASILKAILAERPEHTSSILLMARILFEQGEYDQAVEWSERVYAYEPESTRPGELQYAIYRHTGDWESAISVALKLTRQDRLNTTYMVQLAQAYIERQDFKSAQRPLYKLYGLWEDNPQQLRELAIMQVRSGNLEAARQSLERALAHDVRSYPVRLDLARLSMFEGQLAQSSESVETLRKEFGETSQLSLLEGELALRVGDKQRARDAFESAYTSDMSNTAALVNLYQLSMEGVGGERFTAVLEEALKTTPQPDWVLKLLGDSYMFQGQPQEAARHYENLLSLPAWKDNPAVLNNLAIIYSSSSLERALETAQRGLTTQGKNNPDLLDTVGWVLAQMERPEEALPYLRDAYAMNSTDPEIRYHTGVTLLALGRTAEAEKELRAALASGQEFSGYEDAQRRLDELP